MRIMVLRGRRMLGLRMTSQLSRRLQTDDNADRPLLEHAAAQCEISVFPERTPFVHAYPRNAFGRPCGPI